MLHLQSLLIQRPGLDDMLLPYPVLVNNQYFTPSLPVLLLDIHHACPLLTVRECGLSMRHPQKRRPAVILLANSLP
ncbi:hypothetical protein CSPAE12_07956 [Colletotrichum incanum]|nr:hypothetical protein CSPAE12_07956 [Colletotrichum incanum]